MGHVALPGGSFARATEGVSRRKVCRGDGGGAEI